MLDDMKAISRTRRSQLERATETQSVLVQAAVHLLSRVGYAKTTTQAVARRAGVTTGALHHYFAVKEDLMLAVLDQSAIIVEERLQTLNDAAVATDASVRTVVDHLWEIYGRPDYWAVWEIIIGTRSDEDFHRRVIEHRARSMANVVRPWQKRIESLTAGAFAPGDAAEIFEFLLITIRGLSLERFMDKDTHYFDRHLAMLTDFVSFRLQGASPATVPARPQG
jgi:AcrR family transcriptional regulator